MLFLEYRQCECKSWGRCTWPIRWSSSIWGQYGRPVVVETTPVQASCGCDLGPSLSATILYCSNIFQRPCVDRCAMRLRNMGIPCSCATVFLAETSFCCKSINWLLRRSSIESTNVNRSPVEKPSCDFRTLWALSAPLSRYGLKMEHPVGVAFCKILFQRLKSDFFFRYTTIFF